MSAPLGYAPLIEDPNDDVTEAVLPSGEPARSGRKPLALNPDWLLGRAVIGRGQRRPHLPVGVGDLVTLFGAASFRQNKDLAEAAGMDKRRLSEALTGGPVKEDDLRRLAEAVNIPLDATPLGTMLALCVPRTPFAIQTTAGGTASAGPRGERSSPPSRFGLDRMKGAAWSLRASIGTLAPPINRAHELALVRAKGPRTRASLRLTVAAGEDAEVFVQHAAKTLYKRRRDRYRSVIQLVTDDGCVLATLKGDPSPAVCKAHRKAPPRCGLCDVPDGRDCPHCRAAYKRETGTCVDCLEARTLVPAFAFDIAGTAWQRGLGAAILTQVVSSFVDLERVAFTQLDAFIDTPKRACDYLVMPKLLHGRPRRVVRYAAAGAITGMESGPRRCGTGAVIYDRHAKRAVTGESHMPAEVASWSSWTRIEIRAVQPAAEGCGLDHLFQEVSAFVDGHVWLDLDDVVVSDVEAFFAWIAYWFGPPSHRPTVDAMAKRLSQLEGAADRHAKKVAKKAVARRGHIPSKPTRASTAMWADGMDGAVFVANMLRAQPRTQGHASDAYARALRIICDDFHPALLRVADRHPGLGRLVEAAVAREVDHWHRLLGPRCANRDPKR